MVSGLFLKLFDGFDLQMENLKVIEEFENLDLSKKYGFNIYWYTFGENIQIVVKKVNNAETKIFLADKSIEIESILNNVINEAVKKFKVNTKDQQDIANVLKEHGCCYF